MSGRARTKPLREVAHRVRKGEGGLLREQVLDAAEELLYKNGSMDRVSLRAVAVRVGVTTPAIYLHFEDKDQLFYAVCRRGFDRFAELLGPVIASEGAALDRIRRLGEEYLRFGLENWQQYPILFGAKGELTVPDSEIADDPGLRILNGLVALVEAAQADGDLRSDLAATTIASVLWATSHGTVSLLINAMSHPELTPLPPADEMGEATMAAMIRAFEAK